MSSRPMTQKQRVLRSLERAGQRGITAVDFAAPAVCDGGPPIMRLPSRIDELKQDGHRIVAAGTRHRCRVYVLVAPVALPPDSPAAEATDAPLFAPTVGVAPPRSAVDPAYEDERR